MTRTYPQPHEGITGTARTEPWLGLTDELIPVRQQIIITAAHLYETCIAGGSAPYVRDRFTRMIRPRIGDLVIEQSSFRGYDPHHGFGYLVAVQEEWICSDEDWATLLAEEDALTDAHRANDTATYIQHGPAPADLTRWLNAGFIAVPTKHAHGGDW